MTSKEDEVQIPKKKAISIDDLYRRSTQFRLWSFTTEELEKTRQTTNKKGQKQALEKFQNSLNDFKQQKPEVFNDHEADLSKDSLFEVITLDEELKYLNFYSKNIIQAANFFKMPTQVKATAISFFKKFYLLNSVMEYHPKNVLYTCLFLAAKSENYFISIESFCRALQKTEPKDVLDLEFIILQALKFTLLVHHPFRPLYGFFLDFQQVLLHPEPLPDITIDLIGELYDASKKWLNEYGLLSDVLFLFTPPQIALAAMYDCNSKITEKYLKKKFFKKETLPTIKEENENGTEQKTTEEINKDEYYKLLTIIKKCVEQSRMIEESPREESTKIDRKCFFIINPDKLINKRIKKLTT